MNTKVSFSSRLRYWFDQTMAAGTGALIGWLGIISLIIVFFAAIIILAGIFVFSTLIAVLSSGIESRPRLRIVVMSNRGTVEMEEEIAAQVADLSSSRGRDFFKKISRYMLPAT